MRNFECVRSDQEAALEVAHDRVALLNRKCADLEDEVEQLRQQCRSLEQSRSGAEARVRSLQSTVDGHGSRQHYRRHGGTRPHNNAEVLPSVDWDRGSSSVWEILDDSEDDDRRNILAGGSGGVDGPGKGHLTLPDAQRLLGCLRLMSGSTVDEIARTGEEVVGSLVAEVEASLVKLHAAVIQIEKQNAAKGRRGDSGDVDAGVCCVCRDAPKSVLLLPCKHLCLCATCAVMVDEGCVDRCPVCRETISRHLHVYVS